MCVCVCVCVYADKLSGHMSVKMINFRKKVWLIKKNNTYILTCKIKIILIFEVIVYILFIIIVVFVNDIIR